jgi:hypothetical protein
MGMYTGLRFKAVVKPEFIQMIEKMMEERLDWEELFNLYPQRQFLKEFSKYPRSRFIPYGSLSYMPRSWETNESDWKLRTPTDGFETEYNKLLRVWSFQCSLKNYESEIEAFLNLIVPNIIETSLHIEYYYEEWARSKFYEIVDGKVKESDREGILYGYEEEDIRGWGILR